MTLEKYINDIFETYPIFQVITILNYTENELIEKLIENKKYKVFQGIFNIIDGNKVILINFSNN